MDNNDNNFKKFAVIGNPVSHSLSPQIHQAFSKQTNIPLQYDRVQSPLTSLDKTIQSLQLQGYTGANITIPFKQEAFHLSNTQSEAATLAQASNLISFNDNASIDASNFDGIGLIQDLTHNNNIILNHTQILIIGAGGATQGIIGPILEQVPKEVVITNRTLSKAEAIAEQFSALGNIHAQPISDLYQKEFNLIINTSSADTTSAPLPLPSNVITPHTHCYDIVYGQQSLFTNWVKQNATSPIINGIGMLVEQAAASFYFWHGIYPETHDILKTLKAEYS